MIEMNAKDNKESTEQQSFSLLHQLKEDGRSQCKSYPLVGNEEERAESKDRK